MKKPLSYRQQIPFYCRKTSQEFRLDPYERYDPMVIRQAALHLADDYWGGYPMQAIFDLVGTHYTKKGDQHILEIGCGVGRWIATLAQSLPRSTCWGIDYSYQMLRQANDYWVLGKALKTDLKNKGFKESILLEGKELNNLSFGLAKASDLPFSNDTQDLVVHSFLFDRLDDPAKALQEMYRVLKVGSQLIMFSPLNFDAADLWEKLYPVFKIRELLESIGFTVTNWIEDINIQEPLDFHGNYIQWKCLGVVARK